MRHHKRQAGKLGWSEKGGTVTFRYPNLHQSRDMFLSQEVRQGGRCREGMRHHRRHAGQRCSAISHLRMPFVCCLFPEKLVLKRVFGRFLHPTLNAGLERNGWQCIFMYQNLHLSRSTFLSHDGRLAGRHSRGMGLNQAWLMPYC